MQEIAQQRKQRISIHALLAESDALSIQLGQWENHFYPRSPCGERPSLCCVGFSSGAISIHALLAESDHWCK